MKAPNAPRSPRFLRDPASRSEYVVARELGMTVARLRDEMPNTEYVAWCAFLALEAQHQELEQKRAAWRR